MTLDEAFPELVGTHLHSELKAAAADKNNRTFEEYVAPYDAWFEYRIYPTSSGVGVFVLDIDQRKRMQQKISLLQELTAALTGALTPRNVAEIIVDRGFALLGAHAGSVNLLREDNTLEIVRGRGDTPDALARFPLLSMDSPTPGADVIRTRKPIFIESREAYQEKYPELVASLQATSGTQALIALPMIVQDQALGSIVMAFPRPMHFTSPERDFMLTLAQQTALALKRALLSEQTQEMVAVQERQRLAQDLHDSVSQALFSATTIAQAIPMTWERDPERAMQQLQQVVQINRAAMSEMRILLLELRPQAIIRTPFSELMKHLIDAAKGRKVIEAELVIEGEEITLPPDVHVALYRMAQESVNNILKHSGAPHFDIHLHYTDGQVRLRVQDDGKGFDPAQTTSGMGLTNLRERANEIGAQLNIASAPEQGTQVQVAWTAPSSDGTGS